jgi:hypothetical protein
MREEQAVEWDADQRQGSEAARAPPSSALSWTRRRVERPLMQLMSRGAAEEMLEMLRERGEVTRRAREAQQRARMCEAALSKTW